MLRYCRLFVLVAASAALALMCLEAAVRCDPPDLRKMKCQPISEAQARRWQRTLRTELASILKMSDLVSCNSKTPFKATTTSARELGSYVSYEMEISSTEARRIEIVVTRPKRVRGKVPALLCVPGHDASLHTCYQQDKGYFAVAKTMAERGYVTISTRVDQHNVFEEGRTLMGERLWDLMRCIDFLMSLPEVDRSRIACIGKSLGGEMAMWLGAMDERIQATVSSAFLTKMDQLERNHCMCWKFDGLRELVDFADIYSLIAPRPLLCQNGLQEPPSQFPVSLARESAKEIEPIYRHLGHPRNFVFLAHEGGHLFDIPSLEAFLEQHFAR